MFVASASYIGRTIDEEMAIYREVGVQHMELAVGEPGFYGMDAGIPASGYTTNLMARMWSRGGYPWEYADPATGWPSWELKELIESYGVRISSFYHNNQPLVLDPNKQRWEIKKVQGLCKMANDWGVEIIRIHGGDALLGVKFQPGPHGGWTGGVWETGIEEVVDRIVAQFKEYVPFAEEYGVDLAMENHFAILQDADRCIRIFDEVGSERLGLNNDTGNWCSGGRSTPWMEDAFKQLAPYTKSTHIKDGKSRERNPFKVQGPMSKIGWREATIIGQGEVPIKTCIQELKKIGYAGPLNIHGGCSDPRVSKFEWFKQSVGYVRSCL